MHTRKIALFPEYQVGVVTIDSSTADRLLGEEDDLVSEATALIKNTLVSESFEPPLLPEVALAMTRIANRPNVSMSEVEQAVAKDPTVAARVIAVANSAAYGSSTQVRSLKQAIVKIGIREVRNVAFEVVAKTRIFRVPEYSERMRELFASAQAAGELSKQLCADLQFESELAYLCGLLHDMGEAIILGIIGLSNQSGNRSRVATRIPLNLLRDTIRANHAQAGALVCRAWGLPGTIVDAVRLHHEPERSSDPSQMASVVALADVLLRHGGIGIEREPLALMEEPRFYQMGLTIDQVEALFAAAEALAESQTSS